MSPALVSPSQVEGGTLGVSRKSAPEVIQGLEMLFYADRVEKLSLLCTTFCYLF